MEKLQWVTKQARVNDLVPQEINPRVITGKQMNDLKKSIQKMNLVEIPAVDLDGKILAGHQRIKALQLLGRGDEVIDIRKPNRKLTKEESNRYLIASNALGGDWDFSKLTELFDQDFLVDIGFDESELQSVWDKSLESEDDDFNVTEELKKIKDPQTKPGDLIILGDHKLLCSDSTDQEAVKALFGNERTSLIYSDSPFNINLNYDKGVGNKSNYGGKVDDNKSPEEYKEFIRKTLTNALSVSKDDFHCFQWSDEAWVWVFQTLYNELGIKNRRLNIWLKNNSSPTPSTAFNKATEFCVYGTKGKPYLSDSLKNLNEIMNKELTTGNKLYEDVTNVWAAKRLASNKYEHPTSKPIDLHEKAIKRCSKVGDIIFDSFSGSASTMICAEQLKRRVFSLEISEVFCDLAIRRWEKLTGKKVEVIKNFYEKR
jgi:DNA modification methylase